MPLLLPFEVDHKVKLLEYLIRLSRTWPETDPGGLVDYADSNFKELQGTWWQEDPKINLEDRLKTEQAIWLEEGDGEIDRRPGYEAGSRYDTLMAEWKDIFDSMLEKDWQNQVDNGRPFEQVPEQVRGKVVPPKGSLSKHTSAPSVAPRTEVGSSPARPVSAAPRTEPKAPSFVLKLKRPAARRTEPPDLTSEHISATPRTEPELPASVPASTPLVAPQIKRIFSPSYLPSSSTKRTVPSGRSSSKSASTPLAASRTEPKDPPRTSALAPLVAPRAEPKKAASKTASTSLVAPRAEAETLPRKTASTPLVTSLAEPEKPAARTASIAFMAPRAEPENPPRTLVSTPLVAPRAELKPSRPITTPLVAPRQEPENRLRTPASTPLVASRAEGKSSPSTSASTPFVTPRIPASTPLMASRAESKNSPSTSASTPFVTSGAEATFSQAEASKPTSSTTAAQAEKAKRDRAIRVERAVDLRVALAREHGREDYAKAWRMQYERSKREPELAHLLYRKFSKKATEAEDRRFQKYWRAALRQLEDRQAHRKQDEEKDLRAEKLADGVAVPKVAGSSPEGDMTGVADAGLQSRNSEDFIHEHGPGPKTKNGPIAESTHDAQDQEIETQSPAKHTAADAPLKNLDVETGDVSAGDVPNSQIRAEQGTAEQSAAAQTKDDESLPPKESGTSSDIGYETTRNQPHRGPIVDKVLGDLQHEPAVMQLLQHDRALSTNANINDLRQRESALELIKTIVTEDPAARTDLNVLAQRLNEIHSQDAEADNPSTARHAHKGHKNSPPSHLRKRRHTPAQSMTAAAGEAAGEAEELANKRQKRAEQGAMEHADSDAPRVPPVPLVRSSDSLLTNGHEARCEPGRSQVGNTGAPLATKGTQIDARPEPHEQDVASSAMSLHQNAETVSARLEAKLDALLNSRHSNGPENRSNTALGTLGGPVIEHTLISSGESILQTETSLLIDAMKGRSPAMVLFRTKLMKQAAEAVINAANSAKRSAETALEACLLVNQLMGDRTTAASSSAVQGPA